MTSKKSPLHPSALRIRDIHIGRHIVPVNIYNRFPWTPKVVVAEPHVWVSPTNGKRLLAVLLRDASGYTHMHFLSDLGVIPHEDGWSVSNYTVDARKMGLIPPAIPDPRPRGIYSRPREFKVTGKDEW